MSASPLCAWARAAPVPNATKLMVIHGYLAWKAVFISPVPGLSSSPVSCRLVVVATVRVVGVGVGVGSAVGDDEGDVVGFAVGVGDAVGEVDVVGFGEGVTVGEEVGDGVGVSVDCVFDPLF